MKRPGRRGLDRQGQEWQGMAGKADQDGIGEELRGLDGTGRAWTGEAGADWHGRERSGGEGNGTERKGKEGFFHFFMMVLESSQAHHEKKQ